VDVNFCMPVGLNDAGNNSCCRKSGTMALGGNPAASFELWILRWARHGEDAGWDCEPTGSREPTGSTARGDFPMSIARLHRGLLSRAKPSFGTTKRSQARESLTVLNEFADFALPKESLHRRRSRPYSRCRCGHRRRWSQLRPRRSGRHRSTRILSTGSIAKRWAGSEPA
jgi:hypothetical protein